MSNGGEDEGSTFHHLAEFQDGLIAEFFSRRRSLGAFWIFKVIPRLPTLSSGTPWVLTVPLTIIYYFS
jgi:hypothetical protein